MTAGLILGLVLLAQATPISVGELLAKADRFNGQPVAVAGVMSNLRGPIWRRGGHRYAFDLTDGREIVHVITFGKPPCQSGVVMVEGTFERVKRRVKVSYSAEEITALSVICR